jgi:DNA helicase-2/ATP-dependent DNA helicase PcrA
MRNIALKIVHLQLNENEDMSVNLQELNESQRAAVLFNDGPSLVIAGAGSGKTRVLTYKIAYLLEQGYPPSSILALTFTNKAAKEMKDRIAKQVGMETARYVWMGTFHSIFSRILRTESATLGFDSNFTIYDQSDSRSLIKNIIKEMQLDEKTYKPATVQTRISNAKNHLILPDAYAADPQLTTADAEAKIPATREIYQRYVARCKQAGAMDFDDLLVYTYILFKEHPEIQRKYADHFRYVLVDEYQDTNYAQHSIVWQLTSERQRVCVVGDDAQSIYSFRGARIENILKFTRQYQGAQLFKLEQNYRSTQTIVQAANSLIYKNQGQIRKEVFSEKEQGERLKVFVAYSDIEEGEIVANQIQQLRRQGGYSYADFAILYRTNAQSRIFEEALRKRSMPYRVYGGLSFYQRKEIKDAIAYFRLAINPHDEEALRRVINYPARGIGNTTIEKLVTAANQSGVSLWSVLENPLGYGLSVNKGTAAKLQGFRELITEFGVEAGKQRADELGQLILSRSGIRDDVYQDRSPENLSRQENLDELLNGMQLFCVDREEAGDEHLSLSDFLSEISLLSDQDNDKTEDEERITMMTVHSAKGLEFKNVFVVGLEEQLFPSGMCSDNPRGLEEERRLFYVAITRAEEHCILSYARSRFRYGKTELGSPSRFLKDIDPRYLEMMDGAGGSLGATARPQIGGGQRPTSYPWQREVEAPKRSDYVRPSLMKQNLRRVPTSSNPVPTSASAPEGGVTAGSTATTGQASFGGQTLRVGQTIAHDRFGVGEITMAAGSGENAKITVNFRNVGEKQLLVKYARFKVVD